MPSWKVIHSMVSSKGHWSCYSSPYAVSYLIPRFCYSRFTNEDTQAQTNTQTSPKPHNTEKLDFLLCSAQFKCQALRSLGTGLPLKAAYIYSGSPGNSANPRKA